MDSIDASIIGLQETLQLLQQYDQSGTLEADVSAAFRKRGPCTAYIVIAEGKIVSCYIQDKITQHESTTEALLALDRDEGPFNWRFHLQQQMLSANTSSSAAIWPQPPSLPKQQLPFPQEQITPDVIPHRIADLDLNWLTEWSSQQQRFLRMVYTLIDGRRTVADIQKSLPLPYAAVQGALIALIAMQIITIDAQ